MEACGGAHFLGRALREQGHEVRLMPAQYVFFFYAKPYVKTNKNAERGMYGFLLKALRIFMATGSARGDLRFCNF